MTPDEFKKLPDDTSGQNRPTRSSQFADEQTVVMFLAELLYRTLGEKGTWSSVTQGGVKFAFAGMKGSCHCLANVEVPYKLPDGSILTHRPDIVADIGGLRVGIEVKFRSSVTDQFKSRSYDMIHIKRSNPRFYGMMVYVKSHSGISPDHAKSICYPHDHFFSVPETGAQRAENWDPFVQEIRRLLN